MESLIECSILPELPLLRVYNIGLNDRCIIHTDEVYTTKINDLYDRAVLKLASSITLDRNINRICDISKVSSIDQCIENVIDDVLQELNTLVYNEAVELGRVTTGIIGKATNSFDKLVISNSTKPKVLLERILYGNKIIHDTTSMNAYCVIVSEMNYDKISDLKEFHNADNDSKFHGVLHLSDEISINVYKLPKYLSRSDHNGVIISGVNPDMNNQGLVGIFKNIEVGIYNNSMDLVEINQRYSLSKIGKKGSLNYVRLFEI